MREACAQACRDLAETLWRRLHGATGPPAPAEWLELVSAKCLGGLGQHPQYLAWLYQHSKETLHLELPFWEPHEYTSMRVYWGEALWYPRVKRDYRIQMENWVEKPASLADIPSRQELNDILSWYAKRLLKDRMARKTQAQRAVDDRLLQEFGATPQNRSWYNEAIWEWLAEARSRDLFPQT